MYLASLLAQTSHFDNVIAFLFEHNLVWRQGSRLVNHVRYVFDIDRVSSVDYLSLLSHFLSLLKHLIMWYLNPLVIGVIEEIEIYRA